MAEWKKVKLGELLKESKIESNNPDSSRRIRVKLNVGGIDHRPEANDKIGATKYYTRKAGQFIYGKQNLHKGAFGIVPEELDGYESSQDLPAFDVHESCYPMWIFYFFKQGNFYLKLSSLAKGIGSKRIQPSQLYELLISLPSKEEQKKILEGISIFEDHSSKIVDEIEKQLNLIKKLRNSILIEGLQGKLTQEWRKETELRESASALLNKIKSQRKKQSVANNAQNEASISKLPKNELGGSVPPGWVWCKLEEYAFCERGRFSARPRNDPKFYNGTIPFIQIGDLPPEGGPISSHRQTLNDLGLTISKLFPKNTIAVAIVGATIGNTGILPYDMCFPDSIVGIKPTESTNNDFLELFLRSKKEHLRSEAYAGGGQPNIKLANINECALLLPPLTEQEVIVVKINKMLLLCDALVDNLNHQLQDFNLLKSDILGSIWGNDEKIPETLATQKSRDGGSTLQMLLDSLNNYEKKDVSMELEELLKENGRMTAVSLWQMSKFQDNIDAFYEELKMKVEEKKTIKESEEKGFLELSK